VSSRSLQQRLRDILEQAEEILVFADGLDFEAFCADARTVKAILYDLAAVFFQIFLTYIPIYLGKKCVL
jgi:uncharacterized protein with HEPN domain